MKIEDEFRVDVPVDEAWKVLLDVERIAPCMPGAALTGIDGDRFTGKVAVKLGPVNLTYQGSGHFVTRDENQRLVVIQASGQDRRGAGTAAATVTATLHPDGEATRVAVVTDLNITGRAAQYGRGMIADVSAKLTGQFADCLARHLAENPAEPGVAAAPVAAEPVTAQPGPVAAAPNGSAPRSAPPTPATLPVPAPPVSPAAGTPAPTVLPTGTATAQTARAAAPVPSPAPPALPQPEARAASRPEPEAAREAAGESADGVPAAVDQGGYRRIDHPEPEPVDLLDVVGVPDPLRRAAPYLLGALTGAVLVWLAMRRRSR